MYSKNRLVVIMVVILSLAVLFSGCGVKSTQTPEQTKEQTKTSTATSTQTETEKVKELQKWKLTVFTEFATEGFKAMFDKVNSNKDLALNVELDIIAGGTSGEDVVKVRFASGDYPELLAHSSATSINTQLNGGKNTSMFN